MNESAATDPVFLPLATYQELLVVGYSARDAVAPDLERKRLSDIGTFLPQ